MRTVRTFQLKTPLPAYQAGETSLDFFGLDELRVTSSCRTVPKGVVLVIALVLTRDLLEFESKPNYEIRVKLGRIEVSRLE